MAATVALAKTPNERRAKLVELSAQFQALAEPVELEDCAHGIVRLKTKTGFRYRNEDGSPVRDDDTLARIRSLAIPPAWTDVWICASPNGRLQATGRDARNRKQYLYHPEFRSGRERAKFRRLKRFGNALPAIRRRAKADICRPELDRERVLAAVVLLLDASLIRVGNRQYLRDNHSIGLTTMQRQHIRASGDTIRFRFTGKSGKDHDITVTNREVARVVRQCRDLRCDFLFAYPGENGVRVCVTSADVNTYLREAAGAKVSAKDFRTWTASVLALDGLLALPPETTARAAKRLLKATLETVSGRLGNTPAIARKSYVHPAILREWEAPARKPIKLNAKPVRGLSQAETRLLAFLKSRRAAG